MMAARPGLAAHPGVPALVIGQGLTVLGVLRSLRDHGVPAYCVLRTTDFVARSNAYRPLPPPYEQLIDLGELPRLLDRLPYRRAVLLPCSDHAVRAVAELPPAYSERYLTSLPPLESVRRLADKGAFAGLLARIGVPHPATVVVTSLETLKRLPEERFRNAFLKPCDSQSFSARFQRKAFRVRDRDEAIRLWQKANRAGLQMMLQEYIPGPADRHYFIDGFVDRHGVVRARFPRRRLRIYPPEFGDSSYLVSVTLEALSPAARSLDRIFAATPYRGVFSAEFKLDARDGRYKILEVNTRPWWFNGFAAACGVDTTLMAYRDALGLDVPTVTSHAVGRRLALYLNDLAACRALHREDRLTLRAWIASWLQARPAVFRLDDPLPALYQLFTVLGSKLLSAGSAARPPAVEHRLR